jgi:hypothetical protein
MQRIARRASHWSGRLHQGGRRRYLLRRTQRNVMLNRVRSARAFRTGTDQEPQQEVELTRSQLVSGTVVPGATYTFSQSPLSRASRPFMGPI